MGLCHVVRRKAECWEIFELFLEGSMVGDVLGHQ